MHCCVVECGVVGKLCEWFEEVEEEWAGWEETTGRGSSIELGS